MTIFYHIKLNQIDVIVEKLANFQPNIGIRTYISIIIIVQELYRIQDTDRSSHRTFIYIHPLLLRTLSKQFRNRKL